MSQYLFTGNSLSSAQQKEATMAYAALSCSTSSERQQHTNTKLIKKNILVRVQRIIQIFSLVLSIFKFHSSKCPYQRHACTRNLLPGTWT